MAKDKQDKALADAFANIEGVLDRVVLTRAQHDELRRNVLLLRSKCKKEDKG